MSSNYFATIIFRPVFFEALQLQDFQLTPPLSFWGSFGPFNSCAVATRIASIHISNSKEDDLMEEEEEENYGSGGNAETAVVPHTPNPMSGALVETPHSTPVASWSTYINEHGDWILASWDSQGYQIQQCMLPPGEEQWTIMQPGNSADMQSSLVWAGGGSAPINCSIYMSNHAASSASARSPQAFTPRRRPASTDLMPPPPPKKAKKKSVPEPNLPGVARNSQYLPGMPKPGTKKAPPPKASTGDTATPSGFVGNNLSKQVQRGSMGINGVHWTP